MAYIQKVRGHEPVIGENTFVAETAVIVGDVTVGRDCSIWFNAVLRGDVNKIVIGDRTNIQDGVVLHTIYDGAKHLGIPQKQVRPGFPRLLGHSRADDHDVRIPAVIVFSGVDFHVGGGEGKAVV